MLEMMTGCEMANKYYVCPLNPGGGKGGSYTFKCKEESGCCERQFCPGPVRPLDICISHISPGSPKDLQPFLRIKKPCKCTFLCWCRPEIEVLLIEGG